MHLTALTGPLLGATAAAATQSAEVWTATADPAALRARVLVLVGSILAALVVAALVYIVARRRHVSANTRALAESAGVKRSALGAEDAVSSQWAADVTASAPDRHDTWRQVFIGQAETDETTHPVFGSPYLDDTPDR